MEQVLKRATGPATFGWRAGAKAIGLMLQVWSERRALERLDARMLADIGLTESDVQREVVRPAWDAPRRATTLR